MLISQKVLEIICLKKSLRYLPLREYCTLGNVLFPILLMVGNTINFLCTEKLVSSIT